MVAVLSTAGVDAVDAPDGGRMRAVSLQAELLRKWKEEVKHKISSERESWLLSVEGFATFGARRCNEMVKAIRRGRTFAQRDVCSDAWLMAVFEAGEQYPPGGDETLMVRSTARTSWGFGGLGVMGATTPTERWLPPHAAGDEDFIDNQTPNEAYFYDHPASPSARAIFLLGQYSRKGVRRLAGSAGNGAVSRERAGARAGDERRAAAREETRSARKK